MTSNDSMLFDLYGALNMTMYSKAPHGQRFTMPIFEPMGVHNTCGCTVISYIVAPIMGLQFGPGL